ncbi:hypothetical protein [Chitinophaga pinensis]|uniref:Uncharacterized protein n=1 Tax=Chitinophaga pinensis TaxID=79329 RepID=A0A5C6LR12_9BACT|nr:hypothetical protein [Chitinophaga pinensis]TWV98929.1 hypothetical protein FEF09_19555 [Chitinophaga pinensis]
MDPEKKNNGLLGLHQSHDGKGPVAWEANEGGTGKFQTMPDYIKGKDGKDKYREATITVFEGNFDQHELAEARKISGDKQLTMEEFMVVTFTHEAYHDTDQKTIDAIKQRMNGGKNDFDVETAAEQKAEQKVFEELKKKRNNNEKTSSQ